MYSGRDRRFYTAIVYDKCSWIGETVELNLGGNLSAGVRDKEDGGWYNTTTGYYWRKGNIENPTPRAYHNCQVALHFNIVRLGEAYMNLAEAYLLKHDVPNAVKALNMTRTIHGGLSESTAATEEEAWTDYIRERNCELTNEAVTFITVICVGNMAVMPIMVVMPEISFMTLTGRYTKCPSAGTGASCWLVK